MAESVIPLRAAPTTYTTKLLMLSWAITLLASTINLHAPSLWYAFFPFMLAASLSTYDCAVIRALDLTFNTAFLLTGSNTNLHSQYLC